MATNLDLDQLAAQSVEPPARGDRHNDQVAFALAVYLLLCSAITVYVMAQIWSGWIDVLRWILPGIDFSALGEDGQHAVRCFSFTSGGAVLGAIILGFRNLHEHAVVLQDFSPRYAGSYIIGPWAAGLLGITSFVMLNGGLLVFGGSSTESSGTSCYAYLALGIITGFSWERLLARIDDAAKQVFGSGCSRGNANHD